MPERSKWQLVAWAVAAVLMVLAAVRMAGPGSGAPPAPPVRIGGAAPVGAAAPNGGPASQGGVYVHVAGEVRRPGLFRLPSGARTAAAIHRAGGPTGRAELAAVNLAQRLEDGQQVIVPRRGSVAAPGTASSVPGAASGAVPEAPLSLATATPEQLEELDGIGPTLAERIIEFRDSNGGFRSLAQLQEVEGIGEKRFASLKEAVRP